MKKQIVIMVVRPGEAPELVHVPTDPLWRSWYPLVHPTTHTLETRPLRPGIDLLCDEQGRRKKFPVNLYLLARAPDIDFTFDFLVEMPRPKGDTRQLMKPGEPGIGYHEILGTFLVARRRGPRYVSLTDDDIAQFGKEFRQLGRVPL